MEKTQLRRTKFRSPYCGSEGQAKQQRSFLQHPVSQMFFGDLPSCPFSNRPRVPRALKCEYICNVVVWHGKHSLGFLNSCNGHHFLRRSMREQKTSSKQTWIVGSSASICVLRNEIFIYDIPLQASVVPLLIHLHPICTVCSS